MNIFVFLSTFFLSCLAGLSTANAEMEDRFRFNEQDSYIHSLASLSYHVHAFEKELNREAPLEEPILFSDDQVHHLWENISQKTYTRTDEPTFYQDHFLFETAYQKYALAKTLICENLNQDALKQLSQSAMLLDSMWKKAIGEELPFSFDDRLELLMRAKSDPNLVDNRYIKYSTERRIRPYAIPMDHPMRPILDKIFSERVTRHRKALEGAGFTIVDRGSRSFICVVSHPSLPGYLLKLHYDIDKRKKQDRDSWEWLVKRCEGAEKIQEIIRKFHIKHFVCAKKWIYCLPAEPSPPKSSQYTRHLAVLLVTDMHLIPLSENLRAWYHNITKSHLDELYIMVTRGKGSSYRPDNMPFTEKGKIAFIDTEYPNRGPDFESIRPYLNTEMRHYWDRIVSDGGP